MYIEHESSMDKEFAKIKIDEQVKKLNNIKFAGDFEIQDLKKSWTNSEMQFSFNLKKISIERRVKGIIKLDNGKVILNFEVPEIIKNFMTEKNLETTIRKQLDTILSLE